ncbi:hypothetical protein JHW43_006150 [Diplocarpon mali]|nr:hypothetical protein JHW43_006150 [Diplocarpon mali]
MRTAAAGAVESAGLDSPTTPTGQDKRRFQRKAATVLTPISPPCSQPRTWEASDTLCYSPSRAAVTITKPLRQQPATREEEAMEESPSQSPSQRAGKPHARPSPAAPAAPPAPRARRLALAMPGARWIMAAPSTRGRRRWRRVDGDGSWGAGEGREQSAECRGSRA